MERSRRWRRAFAWTLVAGALAAQAVGLVRFAADAMAAFIRDPARLSGRWWHGNEPLFSFLGYGVLLPTVFLVVFGWTKAVRKPRDGEVADAATPTDDGGDDKVAIEMPAFLRPKTRRTRKGAGALAGLTVLGLLVAAAGAVLGSIEAMQMWQVLQRNQGNPAALALNSTVWIRRLMLFVAPAVEVVGAAVLGLAWGVYFPLPPAETVVVGAKPQVQAVRWGAEWQGFD